MTEVLYPRRPRTLSANNLHRYTQRQMAVKSRPVSPELSCSHQLASPAQQATLSIPHEPENLPIEHVLATAPKQSNDEQVEQLIKKLQRTPVLGIDFTRVGKKAKSNKHLLSVGQGESNHELLNDSSGTNILSGECCGGGCHLARSAPDSPLASGPPSPRLRPFLLPENDAFASLQLDVSPLSNRTRLSNTTKVPEQNVWLGELPADHPHFSTVLDHPPSFVTPHPPNGVYSAPLENARELTKPGAEKRTYHFDIDIQNYPEEEGTDFRVGGAIGVCAPNSQASVDRIFDLLDIPSPLRDVPVTVRTGGSRWPTIWGEEAARTLQSTRRELLTWTVDIQSFPPKKALLRLLANYATDETEEKILLYLCSRQGQAAFCKLRTGPHISLIQLLSAFPSAAPHLPLEHLLTVLPALMPRWYSLSADPLVRAGACAGKDDKRIIEIAVTVHEDPDWEGGYRTGVGSGFLERQARRFIENPEQKLTIPMFRGLMANPLAREFTVDGPMLLIGAGVGIAPFRGFVQRRLQAANCANKVWVIQGVRDALLDELYSGEWGVHEDDIKKIVESRVGTKKYVQEEVRAQAELVWFVANAQDGRVYVCGSTKGMGEGVEEALVDVAVERGGMSKSEACEFWKKKAESYQYVKETW